MNIAIPMLYSCTEVLLLTMRAERSGTKTSPLPVVDFALYMGQPAKLSTLYPGFRSTGCRFCDRLFFGVAPSSEGIWTRFFFCLKDMELVVLSWEYGTPILSMKYWIQLVVSKILKFLMIIVDHITAVFISKNVLNPDISMFLNVSFRRKHIWSFFNAIGDFETQKKYWKNRKSKCSLIFVHNIWKLVLLYCTVHRVTITQYHPEIQYFA